MDTRGRALYNLIQMGWKEDPNLPIEPWLIEDYRSISTEDLFLRLQKLGISLDETRFLSYAESAESPEELTDTLWVDEDSEEYDKAYLLIFELWRRLLSEKQSLSIFCDELDHLIDLYDRDLLPADDVLQDLLIDLERLLDENVDQGEDPRELFQELTFYCAHDLETFIYDFASKEIDQGHFLTASEIIDAFMSYIADLKWFDFLRLRLLANTDPDAAESMLAKIIEDQRKEPDFEFLLEIARFLVNRGSVQFFVETIKLSSNLLETEEDFQEILGITFEFYRMLDQEKKMQQISQILKNRNNVPLESEIASDDKDFKDFFRLVEDLDRNET